MRDQKHLVTTSDRLRAEALRICDGASINNNHREDPIAGISVRSMQVMIDGHPYTVTIHVQEDNR